MNSEPSLLASALSLLRWYLEMLVKDFGRPSALRKQGAIDPVQRAKLLAWLRPIEAGARRLLIALALEIPPDPAPAPSTRKFPKHLRKKKRGIWFRILPPARAAAPRRKGVGRLHDPYAAAPLADRLAALRRVAMTPGVYAARLARRLHAAPLALKAPKVTDAEPRPAHVFHRIAHEMFEEAIARTRGPPAPAPS